MLLVFVYLQGIVSIAVQIENMSGIEGDNRFVNFLFLKPTRAGLSFIIPSSDVLVLLSFLDIVIHSSGILHRLTHAPMASAIVNIDKTVSTGVNRIPNGV